MVPFVDLSLLLDSLNLTISCDNSANLSRYSSFFSSKSSIKQKAYISLPRYEENRVIKFLYVDFLLICEFEWFADCQVPFVQLLLHLTHFDQFFYEGWWIVYLWAFFRAVGWKCQIHWGSSKLPRTFPWARWSTFTCELHIALSITYISHRWVTWFESTSTWGS